MVELFWNGSIDFNEVLNTFDRFENMVDKMFWLAYPYSLQIFKCRITMETNTRVVLL